MAKKKGTITKLIKDAKSKKYGYEIGGKPVSEFKFFVNLRREMRGEVVKKTFYWTDKKVIASFKLFGIKITPNILRGIKGQLSKRGDN